MQSTRGEKVVAPDRVVTVEGRHLDGLDALHHWKLARDQRGSEMRTAAG